VTPALTGHVVSVQVGLPALLPWRESHVPSAIVKHEVDGPVALGAEGLDGDAQADRTVHGGPEKAVCCYPVEHLTDLAQRIGAELAPGAFGENLSVRGLTEDVVHIGDAFALGTATVQVSQPRGPCFKLAARWGHKQLPAILARESISGYYLRVLRPGVVSAGDELLLVERRSEVSVADVMRVTYTDRRNSEAIRAVLEADDLATSWHEALLGMWQRSAPPIDSFGVEDE
jgi:MOSC domain-containing protein YiiM